MCIRDRKYYVGMSAFSASAERAKVVDFVTYGAGGSGIAVPKGNPKALSMDPMTLCGRTIAAQKGTIQGLDYLPKFSADCTACLLYTSDAADDLLRVDLGGPRLIKKKTPQV